MNKILSFTAAMLLFTISGVAQAAHHENPCNPCAMNNPCSMNPCNPCSMKKSMNPFNPCAMKKQANPCSMNPCGMNPCSMKKPSNPCAMNPCAGSSDSGSKNTPIRPRAFSNFGEAVALGKKLWHDDKLGTSGLSCASCHAGYENLNLGKNQNYPHFVKMVGDVVTLDQMINYCMVNPMKGEQFDQNSKELTGLAAYFRAYRMNYLREQR